MGKPYAELLGDPVGHSKSPAIHTFWLEKMGLDGDYRPVRVPAGGLKAHFEQRRSDPYWRGCNLTAPLKREGAKLVGDPTGVCAWLGAVNCIFKSPLACLVPANTDLAGIETAMAGVKVEGETICLVGAGGAAMAALCWLVGRKAKQVTILARNPAKARSLAALPGSASGATAIAAAPIEQAVEAASGATLLINATPLGMTGGPPTRPELFDLIGRLGEGSTLFDMVYAPAETELLRAARRRGLGAVDGLTMLIGQAAPAFELFFGIPAPRGHEAELRERLA
jgi:shikimate dehydrogenase